MVAYWSLNERPFLDQEVFKRDDVAQEIVVSISCTPSMLLSLSMLLKLA